MKFIGAIGVFALCFFFSACEIEDNTSQNNSLIDSPTSMKSQTSPGYVGTDGSMVRLVWVKAYTGTTITLCARRYLVECDNVDIIVKYQVSGSNVWVPEKMTPDSLSDSTRYYHNLPLTTAKFYLEIKYYSQTFTDGTATRPYINYGNWSYVSYGIAFLEARISATGIKGAVYAPKYTHVGPPIIPSLYINGTKIANSKITWTEQTSPFSGMSTWVFDYPMTYVPYYDYYSLAVAYQGTDVYNTTYDYNDDYCGVEYWISRAYRPSIQ